MNKLALYCRSGFEKEAAAEINAKAAELGVFGFARVIDNSAYVIFECYQPGEADQLARQLPFNELIFIRQLIVVSDLLQNLDPTDRISPILAQYQALHQRLNLSVRHRTKNHPFCFYLNFFHRIFPLSIYQLFFFLKYEYFKSQFQH